jgi:hypothetical protein
MARSRATGLSVTGPVSSSTAAARIVHAQLSYLSIWHGIRFSGMFDTAVENMMLKLEPGEQTRGTCYGYVSGFGLAVLIPTDRRLLGEGVGPWRCAALWSDIDAARPRFDRLDTKGLPEHELIVSGIPITLRGPPHIQDEVFAAVLRGILEDALMWPLRTQQ